MKITLQSGALLFCMCSSILGGEIDVTIEPTSNYVSLVTSGAVLTNTEGASPEDFDFLVCIRNASTNSLRFFEEWNSWGYENLKLTFYNGWHDYWIVKCPGHWPRNFPSSILIHPGRGFVIPVRLDTNTWAGVSEAQADRNANHIRALYEQFSSPTNPPPCSPGLHWNGSQSSKYYRIDEIMSNPTRKDDSNNAVGAPCQ